LEELIKYLWNRTTQLYANGTAFTIRPTMAYCCQLEDVVYTTIDLEANAPYKKTVNFFSPSKEKLNLKIISTFSLQ